MSQIIRPTWSALCALLLGLACTNGAEPGSTNAVGEKAQRLEERGPRRGGEERRFDGRAGRNLGPAGILVRAAIEEVDLSAEQKTRLEGLLARLGDGRRGRNAPSTESREAIVAAVRSGSVADLQTATAAAEGRAAERATEIAIVLNELHTTLDASQRQAIVQAAREQLERRGSGKRPGRHAEGDEAGGFGPSAHRGRLEGEGNFGARGMDRMVESLGLDAEQRARLEAAMQATQPARPTAEERTARRERRQEGIEGLLSAFGQDDFDASRLGLAEDFTESARARGDLRADHLEVLLPILTDAQRASLADRMERRFDEGRTSGRHPRRGRFERDRIEGPRDAVER